MLNADISIEFTRQQEPRLLPCEVEPGRKSLAAILARTVDRYGYQANHQEHKSESLHFESPFGEFDMLTALRRSLGKSVNKRLNGE
jgi:hypothetical protein